MRARKPSVKRHARLVLALCSLCLSWSQQPPSITLKSTVREVIVPVIVKDASGHVVSNLKQSDFSVFEDEVRQRIVAFSATDDPSVQMAAEQIAQPPTGEKSSGVSAPQAGPDSPTRTYLVGVDTLHSSFGNIQQARKALEKFFEREHDARAQYALMNLSRQLEVVQDSTRDPSLVLAALGSKRFQKSLVDSESANLAWESEQLRRMLVGFSPQACETPGVRVRGSTPDTCSDMKRQVQMFVNKSAERTALLTRLFLQELKTMIVAMGSMPTQRTLVLISDGFNLVPGRELFGIASAYFPNDPEWRFNERDTQSELNEISGLAQKNNVIVYALDSRGVYTPASTGLGDASHEGDGNWTGGNAMSEMVRAEDRIAWENGNAMAELAKATGGVYFHDNNDLRSGLRRVFDDQRQRYLIVYSSSNDAADGKFRKIRVNVENKKLHVFAKSGYWAPAN